MSDKDVIIACDFKDREELFNFLDLFGDLRPFLKIGMELFYSEGKGLVKQLKDEGYDIFFDLKLHDIPTTVEKSMRVLGGMGVDIVNVHAAGGIDMMRAARRGLDSTMAGQQTKLIAVTQLTSTSQQMLSEELLIDKPMPHVVSKILKYSLFACFFE